MSAPSVRVLALAGLALLTCTPSLAAEVQVEGSYRARFRAFDTLSLTRDLATSERGSAYLQHRLILRPRFLLSEHVGLFMEVKGLDNVVWGSDPNPYWDHTQDDDGAPIFNPWNDDVVPPTGNMTENQGTAMFTDFTLWRVYGQVNTPIGRFKFGRMPVHWGLGIWQNDGLASTADYGDTVDRIQYETNFNSIYLRFAVDVDVEGFVNDKDNTTSLNFAGAYRTERATAGLNAQVRFSPATNLTLFTLDVAGGIQLGPVDIQTEFAGQFGNGDLDEANDRSIMGFGGVLEAEIAINKIRLGIDGGFATGDKDPNDQRHRTYTFDRDYTIGVVMFEQNMPVLASTTLTEDVTNRDWTHTLSGNAVSNALYIKPQIGYQVHDKLLADFYWLGARTAVDPDKEAGRSSYGSELGLGLTYKPYQHFELSARGALFLPGSYYKNYSTETGTEFTIDINTFKSTVWGAQVQGRISF